MFIISERVRFLGIGKKMIYKHLYFLCKIPRNVTSTVKHKLMAASYFFHLWMEKLMLTNIVTIIL